MSFKSQLHEYAQKEGFPKPVYEITSEGPHHNPSFRAIAIVNGIRFQSLPGLTNRKAVEQSAAQVALEELGKARDVECNYKQKEPKHTNSHRDEIVNAANAKTNRFYDNNSSRNPFDHLVENLSYSEKLILLKKIVKDL